jgi:hypothetical protein
MLVGDHPQAFERLLEQLARERVLAAAADEDALPVPDRRGDRVVAGRARDLEPLGEDALRSRHVLAPHRHDAEPLVRAGLGLLVADLMHDRQRLLAEPDHLQRAARAEVERPGAHERPRTLRRGLGRRRDRRIEPAPALDEETARHPEPEQRRGQA